MSNEIIAKINAVLPQLFRADGSTEIAGKVAVICEAQIAAAVQAEREVCASGLNAAARTLRLRDANERGIPDRMGHSFEADAADAWAAAIRARGPTDALAQAVAAAEARGRQVVLADLLLTVEAIEGNIPHMKARDYPDDMGRLVDDFKEAIRAAQQEGT